MLSEQLFDRSDEADRQNVVARPKRALRSDLTIATVGQAGSHAPLVREKLLKYQQLFGD